MDYPQPALARSREKINAIITDAVACVSACGTRQANSESAKT